MYASQKFTGTLALRHTRNGRVQEDCSEGLLRSIKVIFRPPSCRLRVCTLGLQVAFLLASFWSTPDTISVGSSCYPD